MKKTTLFTIILFLFLFSNNNLRANNLSLTNIAVDQVNGWVTFTISWANSWRTNPAIAPYNWDAAWVFVKFRNCADATATTQFTHGLVSTTVADHNFDFNGDGAQVEPTSSDGLTVPGIDAGPNNTGVMLRRPTANTFGAVTEQVRLNITNLPAAGTTIDVRVFGIEMVYCVGGASVGALPHYVGDGNGVVATNWSLMTGACNMIAAQVASENAITLYEGNTCAAYAVQAGFPKGYAPFYMMKHEISQQQYCDFLNVLSDNAAAQRYPGSNGSFRHTIAWTINPPPNMYSVTRPDRACNYIGWADVSAYLDWACLRPLTELEFEKAARGFLAKTLYEFPWGTITAINPATFTGGWGSENGTETITLATNANVCSGNWNIFDGAWSTGPIRCGIFATGASSRTQAGAGYFGVLDIAGNVAEHYIKINAGVVAGICAAGISWGNGTLTAAGVHDVVNWPTAAAPGANIIRRGGNWASGAGANSAIGTSYRGEGSVATREQYIGGRGGR